LNRKRFIEAFEKLPDFAVAAAVFGCAFLLCLALKLFGSDANYASMLFFLAVFLVSRLTDGYAYGIAASFFGVLAVNYFFTYPYFKFNFTLSGYPLTVVCMLAVSVITSTITTKAQESTRIKLEAEKEKTRSNLLRAVSHDLRTPLASIMGAVTAVMENDEHLSAVQRKELLTGAKDDARWLIRMVENLLAVTKIDSDKNAKVIKTPEAAEEVVSEAAAKFAKQFPDMRVSVRVPEELLMIPMDAVLIEQVLLNLLENAAIHAKGASLVNITVTVEDNSAVFEVSDNGSGIDPEMLPHIFDGYNHSDTKSETLDGKRSMEIGLSVCKTIIGAHGGVMSAYNSDASGAVFRFTLDLGNTGTEDSDEL